MHAVVILLASFLLASAYASCSLSGKYTAFNEYNGFSLKPLTGDVTFKGSSITFMNTIGNCTSTVKGSYTYNAVSGDFTYNFGGNNPSYSNSLSNPDCTALFGVLTAFLGASTTPTTVVTISDDCSSYNETITVSLGSGGTQDIPRYWYRATSTTSSSANSLILFVSLHLVLLYVALSF